MKILKNNLFLFGLTLVLVSFNGCGSSGGDAGNKDNDATAVANNSGTGASVSMDATASGVQKALESLADDGSNLIKASTRQVTGTEEIDCGGTGTATTTYDVTEETESSGFGSATTVMTNCGGATTTTEGLTATFTYSGYSEEEDSSENLMSFAVISVERAVSSIDGTVTVEVDDGDVSLTFDNDSAEATLTTVIVDGSMTSICVEGTATTLVNDTDEGICEWDTCVDISDVSALAEACEAVAADE